MDMGMVGMSAGRCILGLFLLILDRRPNDKKKDELKI